MIKKNIKKNIISYLLLIFLIFFSYSSQRAREILVYADEISYDKDENLIGKGNARQH